MSKGHEAYTREGRSNDIPRARDLVRNWAQEGDARLRGGFGEDRRHLLLLRALGRRALRLVRRLQPGQKPPHPTRRRGRLRWRFAPSCCGRGSLGPVLLALLLLGSRAAAEAFELAQQLVRSRVHLLEHPAAHLLFVESRGPLPSFQLQAVLGQHFVHRAGALRCLCGQHTRRLVRRDDGQRR